ncbi:hypothetical protein HCN44_007516 [Aphidius gifuensis]|uniref:Gustatory receptor n=1 Tax=Aphidius gifuensis TaxID=684658 RepID=A0A835CL97_APHGI|nr:uncharacterized protein LOC122859375 [Aphidius gifuensis]KAF7988022.1 hypothetical protein HCN44_007516 [Aphidius gifuensis]
MNKSISLLQTVLAPGTVCCSIANKYIMSRYSLMYLLIALGVTCCINSVYTKPIQVLKNIPGYISVYIRHGDEPLNEINPELADAFNENNNMDVVPMEKISSKDFSSVEDKLFGSESLNSLVIFNKEIRELSHSRSSVQV